MSRDEVPARTDLDPVRGDPMVAGALAGPVTIDPDVAVAVPAPVTRHPDVPVAWRRNGDHARRGRRDTDVDGDRSGLAGGSTQAGHPGDQHAQHSATQRHVRSPLAELMPITNGGPRAPVDRIWQPAPTRSSLKETAAGTPPRC